ncbi:puromycin N-acetyltransferase [Colletotrichum spaethianum]|uniref:Puromycin N-acetyltransferase n=1 Tax=Colletotrichum spaethianum TaxID=700344 RepID=A0AA37UJY7_9PEZI|nr:puromycin N-acetyltransferase [Colletotrichum spaethianum]GKT49081.1 puromycin N-acetyltransferase [Colletotrichum spaethianum]
MPKPEFHIRPGTSDDLPAVVDIYMASFGHDWAVEKMQPHRHEFPEDWRAWAHRYFYARYWGPEQQLFYVLVIPDPSSASGERITAFAWWRRPYPTPEEKSATEGALTVRGWLKPVLLGINSLSGYLWPPRSIDPAMADIFDDTHIASDPIKEDPEHPKRKNAWYLSTLGVYPELQGKGYGSLLVREGLRQVDKEGVPAWLIGLGGVEPFYERLGFVVKGRANVGRLADWDGGAIMYRE